MYTAKTIAASATAYLTAALPRIALARYDPTCVPLLRRLARGEDGPRRVHTQTYVRLRHICECDARGLRGGNMDGMRGGNMDGMRGGNMDGMRGWYAVGSTFSRNVP